MLKPEVTYNFEVADYHTYYVSECNVLVHNMCNKVKDGSYEAIVNSSNEHGRPHAHILKEGKRMAKIDVNKNVVKGTLDKGGKRFISKYWEKIRKIIIEVYPKKQ